MGVIINLHDVHNPKWLDSILFFLEKNYHPVPIAELDIFSRNGDRIKSFCHLTVDDGDLSFYNVIFPVLKAHKFHATVFISPEIAVKKTNFWFQEVDGYERPKLLNIISELTGLSVYEIYKFPVLHILKCLTIEIIWEIIKTYKKRHKPEDKPCQNMSIGELEELDSSGLVTLGAHTLRHPILSNEGMAVSKHEIISSIDGMANILGHEIDCFAYPNGIPELDFGQREMELLREAGCKYSFSTESGNFESGSSLLSIPRYGVSPGDSIAYIRTKILAGSHWNSIMKLKPGNEVRNRRAVSQTIHNN